IAKRPGGGERSPSNVGINNFFEAEREVWFLRRPSVRVSPRGEPLADPGAKAVEPRRFGQTLAQREGLQHQGGREHRQGEAPLDRLVRAPLDQSDELESLAPRPVT